MIQIEAIRVREFRGIRDLTIKPERKSFVISGPNGSGKSGIVDAIQFGLTGDIARLAGKGSGGLSVKSHGPHVIRRNEPHVSEVNLKLYIPELNLSTVLTRNIKTSSVFKIKPDSPQIRAIVEEAGKHPELTLSRREIIKYIIVEAGERSKDIQALLQLDDIGNIRNALNQAKNKLSLAKSNAREYERTAKGTLLRHLDISQSTKTEILSAVNRRRSVLSLPEITDLKHDTHVDAGMSLSSSSKPFNKESALRDVGALSDAQLGFETLGAEASTSILNDLKRLEIDPALRDAVKRCSFVERGLELLDSALCPLCDIEWQDEEHLRAHLRTKLDKSRQAEIIQGRLLENAAKIVNHSAVILDLVSAVQVAAKSQKDHQLLSTLDSWREYLVDIKGSLTTVDGLLNHQSDFVNGWLAVPPGLTTHLAVLTTTIKATPDQSAPVDAQTFLARAQDRLEEYVRAQINHKQAVEAEEAATLAYEIYCEACESKLSELYQTVEKQFSNYYQEINADNEAAFTAKIAPHEGKLDLTVDFHEFGMFPPGAYHSEGHQDGMGVCLYLALMRCVLGDRFCFAVLDDVVMSVDHGHRKSLCKLLKSQFPNTQFIITTHDKVWAKQMQTEGLIGTRAGLAFHGWSVTTGPVYEQIAEVWDEIEGDLETNDIPSAAARLRRHLEYLSSEMADNLGARPPYRGDFSYDLGDLLPAVIGRYGDLLKLAASAAAHWKNQDAIAAIDALKTQRSDTLNEHRGEDWVINRAIHYNEWADFTAIEFREAVAAFKALLQLFKCQVPECGSLLYVTPRKGDAEQLRCSCMSVNINLKLR